MSDSFQGAVSGFVNIKSLQTTVDNLEASVTFSCFVQQLQPFFYYCKSSFWKSSSAIFLAASSGYVLLLL